MQLDLTDEETRALLNLLVEAIEADPNPPSPRIRLLREILAKFGELGPAPPPPARRYLLQIVSTGEWKTVAYLNDLDEAWRTTAEVPNTRVFDMWRQEALKPTSSRA